MDEEVAEAQQRKNNLINELGGDALKHERAASLYEFYVSASFYGSLIFGGLAVAAGLVKSITIPSELISLFAALGTGLTVLSREAKYRAKADWHYAVRDTAKQLIARLKYEMPLQITPDNVAAISEEWRRKRTELGAKIAAVNGSVNQGEKTPAAHKS